MYQWEELLAKSKKKIDFADHIITQSVPLLNEPKLLINAVENLFLGYSYAMTAVLIKDFAYKRIQNPGNTFDEKLGIFQKYALECMGYLLM